MLPQISESLLALRMWSRSSQRLSAGLVFITLTSAIPEAMGDGKNVMLLMVDDLRPQLQAYAEATGLNGAALVQTPAIDRLVTESTLFQRAYCSVPICGASRLSLLTGLRPYKEPGKPWGRQWTYSSRLREANQEEPAGINYAGTTMPQHFKNNGYRMLSIGKVYHNSDDDREAWDEVIREMEPWGDVPAFEIGVGEKNQDEAYVDGRNAADVIKKLAGLKDESFFYAIGFPRPHLPFNAPKKYWDLYPKESVELPPNSRAPIDAPRESLHRWGELRNYTGLVFSDEEETRLEDDYARTLIRGYWASVSYVDAQIAKIVDTLKTTHDSEGVSLFDKTIIVLWGDHGYNLGEHNLWAKHALYRTAVQVPLMIRDPESGKGQSVTALVESVDLYPTLCDMAGIGLPPDTKTSEGGTFALEGTSLVPLMEDPSRAWKTAIFSRFVLGDTVRTDRYAYSEYVDAEDNLLSAMLYDTQRDPQENHNIAAHNPELVAQLSDLLGGGTPEGKRHAWKQVVDIENSNAPITIQLPLPPAKYPKNYTPFP